MTVLVRSFFDAFADGVLSKDKDNVMPQDLSPADVKSSLLNHYGNINGRFFDVMFYIISRLTHDDMDDIKRQLSDAFANSQPDVPQLLSLACCNDSLFQTMIEEYKHSFSLLLVGQLPLNESHLMADNNKETIKIKPSLAVQLIVRTVVKAYLSGLSLSDGGKSAFRYATVFNIMTCNINSLINDNEDYKHLDTPEQMLRYACGCDENMAVAMTELNARMADLVEEI